MADHIDKEVKCSFQQVCRASREGWGEKTTEGGGTTIIKETNEAQRKSGIEGCGEQSQEIIEKFHKSESNVDVK